MNVNQGRPNLRSRKGPSYKIKILYLEVSSSYDMNLRNSRSPSVMDLWTNQRLALSVSANKS